MSFLRILKENPTQMENIFVVSGLPRSGTSLMMQLLHAAGIEPLTDKIRSADDDNPKGYYEFERVKNLKKGDYSWLQDANGKAVKIITALITYLPSNYNYSVLFMQRNLDEVLRSQRKMLVRQGESIADFSESALREIYKKHLASVTAWLQEQPNIHLLIVDFNLLMKDPLTQTQELARFIDKQKATESLISVIDPLLYRNR